MKQLLWVFLMATVTQGCARAADAPTALTLPPGGSIRVAFVLSEAPP
jgi:hypothetical protein